MRQPPGFVADLIADMPESPRLLVLDSITQALGDVRGGALGAVIVSGSHGGISAGRFALLAAPHAVIFNDAGVGLDDAGIAALALLQDAGIAACAVAHGSARIGEARSTLEHGRISHCNARASALGARPAMACRDWIALLAARED